MNVKEHQDYVVEEHVKILLVAINVNVLLVMSCLLTNKVVKVCEKEALIDIEMCEYFQH